MGAGGGGVDGVFFLAGVVCKDRWRVNYLDGRIGVEESTGASLKMEQSFDQAGCVPFRRGTWIPCGGISGETGGWSVWALRFVVSQLVAGGLLEWRRFWGFRCHYWVMASVDFCSFRQQLVDRVPVEC
jgi:hypothetical protein